MKIDKLANEIREEKDLNKNIEKTLTEKLEELVAGSKSRLPEDIQKVFGEATEELRASSIEENALKVGDTVPEFTLNNAYGKSINSQDLLEKGALVVSFYRGKWCPYCNLELQEYMMKIEEIKELGASFIAISPELPDESLSDKMPFDILSDIGNSVAKKFNLVFKVDSKVNEIYKGFGIDLEKSNGDDSINLPMPGTYVINKDGEIVLSFVNADYTKRLDVKTVIEKLKEIK